MDEEGVASLSGAAFPVWPLPPDPTAAAIARSIVRSVSIGLGMAPDTVQDAQTIISELAANAILHGDRERAEVWAYVSRLNRPRVMFTVFDAAPWRGPAYIPAGPLTPSEASCGRGLALVSALTSEVGGRWGVHPTRCRLGTSPVSGKAVYFTVPLPEVPLTASLPQVRWPAPGIRHPVADDVEVIEQIVRHREELAAAGVMPCAHSWDLR